MYKRQRYSTEKTSEILDQIKDMGFKYSTVAGVTVSLSAVSKALRKRLWSFVGCGYAGIGRFPMWYIGDLV